MKLDVKTPCASCPYRRSSRLAFWDAGHFKDLVQNDADKLLGAVYGCHATRKNAEPSLCAGWLLDQARRGIPSIQLRIALMHAEDEGVDLHEYMRELDASVPAGELYDSIDEMVVANMAAYGTSVCEHGDHPAPPGMRFCCEACRDCEQESGTAPGLFCAGLCGFDDEERPLARRIQLSRRRGFDLQKVSLELNGLRAVHCARPSKWGNPFTMVDRSKQERARVVELHKRWLSNEPTGNAVASDARRVLRGRNLACWCRLDQACHCDALLEVANAVLEGR